MALASSLRFETSKRGPSISKAQAMQLERVKVYKSGPDHSPLQQFAEKDEIIAAQEQLTRNDMKATLRAGWNESLEEASERRSLKAKMEEIKKELRLANKAVIEVRRHQLRELLQSEQQQQEAELQNMGLTFHQDRL